MKLSEKGVGAMKKQTIKAEKFVVAIEAFEDDFDKALREAVRKGRVWVTRGRDGRLVYAARPE